MAGEVQSASARRLFDEVMTRPAASHSVKGSRVQVTEVTDLDDAQLPGLSALKTEIERKRLLATAEALESGIEASINHSYNAAREERKKSIGGKVSHFKYKLQGFLDPAIITIAPAAFGAISGIIIMGATSPAAETPGTALGFWGILAYPAALHLIRAFGHKLYHAFLGLTTPRPDKTQNLEEPQREALRLSREIDVKANLIAKEKSYSAAERGEVRSLLVTRQVEILRAAADELGKAPKTISRGSALD